MDLFMGQFPILRPGTEEYRANLDQQPFPVADDLARYLCLPPFEHGPVWTDPERVNLVMDFWVARLERAPRSRREPVYSEFCAKYLPDLVEDMMFEPTASAIFSSYTAALYPLRQNPYFAKYMLATHGSVTNGERLAAWISERIVTEFDAADALGDISLEGLNTLSITAELLYHLLAFSATDAKNVLPPGIKRRLVANMDHWANIAVGMPSSWRSFKWVVGVLKGQERWTKAGEELKLKLEGLQACARPGCGAEYDLMQCGKCLTVLYCGRAHQAEHWRDPLEPHKRMCYRTAWDRVVART